jgi:hypothetical protein
MHPLAARELKPLLTPLGQWHQKGGDQVRSRTAFIFICMGFLAAIVGGCAGVQRQAFNRDDNRSISRIGLLEQTEQEKYFVENLGHPGVAFGLIGGIVAAIDIETKKNSFSELMSARQFRLVDEFQTAIAKELGNVGYTVKMIKPIRTKHAMLEEYKALDSEVDAYLDFTIRAGYMCASSAADYIPAVHTVVRLVKSGTMEIIYQEVIYYGYKLGAKEAASITADGQYYFGDFGTLSSNADLALEGLRKGVALTANHIAQTLNR